MATVKYPVATANAGSVVLDLHYDDQSLLILDVTCMNNSAKGKLTITLFGKGPTPPAGTTVFGPKTYIAQSGTTVDSLTNLNAHMVHETGTGKFGPYDQIVPPVTYTVEWAGG